MLAVINRCPSGSALFLLPSTMTSIKTKGPYYTAFFQLWGRYPIVKLVLFAGLALYDLVGDVAFLMAVRTYPLVALKAYIRTGSSPQITVSTLSIKIPARMGVICE